MEARWQALKILIRFAKTVSYVFFMEKWKFVSLAKGMVLYLLLGIGIPSYKYTCLGTKRNAWGSVETFKVYCAINLSQGGTLEPEKKQWGQPGPTGMVRPFGLTRRRDRRGGFRSGARLFVEASAAQAVWR